MLLKLIIIKKLLAKKAHKISPPEVDDQHFLMVKFLSLFAEKVK